MKKLETAFNERIRQMIEVAKTEIKYNPTYFIRMVNDMGAVAACKQLLNDNKIHEGLIRLYQEQRLDLTIESIILEPQWRDLFSAEERTKAADKLKKLK